MSLTQTLSALSHAVNGAKNRPHILVRFVEYGPNEIYVRLRTTRSDGVSVMVDVDRKARIINSLNDLFVNGFTLEGYVSELPVNYFSEAIDKYADLVAKRKNS